MSVVWNLQFDSQEDINKIRKNMDDSEVSIPVTGNISSAANNPEVDPSCLVLSADNKEEILAFLGSLKINAKVLSR